MYDSKIEIARTPTMPVANPKCMRDQLADSLISCNADLATLLSIIQNGKVSLVHATCVGVGFIEIIVVESAGRAKNGIA